jgi:hypothetical protein
MVPVRYLRSDFSAQMLFEKPIFDWRPLPERFFSALYASISSKYRVSPRDFSAASNTNVVGDLWLRFNLYGGANTVTLFADRIEIQFSGLNTADAVIASDVTRIAHDAFVGAFPEIEIGAVEYRLYIHLELVGRSSTEEYFAEFLPPMLREGAERWGGVLQPGIQFRRVGPDQKSVIACSGERSLLSASAVFLVMTISLSDPITLPTFDDKSRRINEELTECLAALQLELVVDEPKDA